MIEFMLKLYDITTHEHIRNFYIWIEPTQKAVRSAIESHGFNPDKVYWEVC